MIYNKFINIQNALLKIAYNFKIPVNFNTNKD